MRRTIRVRRRARGAVNDSAPAATPTSGSSPAATAQSSSPSSSPSVQSSASSSSSSSSSSTLPSPPSVSSSSPPTIPSPATQTSSSSLATPMFSFTSSSPTPSLPTAASSGGNTSAFGFSPATASSSTAQPFSFSGFSTSANAAPASSYAPAPRASGFTFSSAPSNDSSSSGSRTTSFGGQRMSRFHNSAFTTTSSFTSPAPAASDSGNLEGPRAGLKVSTGSSIPLVPVHEVDEESELWCSIHHDLMNDPAKSTNCSHAFCRTCLLQWMRRPHKEGATCPVCRAPIVSITMATEVKEHFDNLLVHCNYGCKKHNDDWVVDPTGCPDTFPFKDRAKHEEECGFKEVVCPRSSQYCQPMQRRLVAEHLRTCPYAFVSLASHLIEIHVGGKKFTTNKHTLTSVPSRFHEALQVYNEHAGYIKFDRDPTHFQYILNYLRDEGAVDLPLDPLVLRQLRREAHFYGLIELEKQIQQALRAPNLDTRVYTVTNEQDCTQLIRSQQAEGFEVKSMCSGPGAVFLHFARPMGVLVVEPEPTVASVTAAMSTARVASSAPAKPTSPKVVTPTTVDSSQKKDQAEPTI